VAAVAAAPRPRHAVAAVPRPPAAAPDPEGERRRRPCAVAAVPRPVAATPLPRRAVAEVTRSAAGALVRASGGVPEAPRRRHFQGRQASDARRRASSDDDA
jgi:hypothetical protein